MDTENTQPQKISGSTNLMRNIRRVLIVLTIIAIVILLITIPIIKSLEKQGWTSYDENNVFYDLTYDSKGNLWAGTSRGITMFAQDGSWTTYNNLYKSADDTDISIYALVFDEKNNSWIGTNGGLSTRTPGGKWTTYSKDNSDLISLIIRALVYDKKGNLWIGGIGNFVGGNGGLNMLTPDGKWTTYTTANSGLNNDRIDALAFDENDTLWIGTDNGLSMLAPDGKWTTYTTTNSGLNNNDIFALTFDKKGNLWIGTEDGVSRLDPTGNWKNYSAYTDPNEPADMIFDENDNLWIATNTGVSRLAPNGQWTTYTTTNSGLNNDLDANGDIVHGLVFDEKGNLWIGRYHGYSKLDVEGIRPINNDLALHRARPVINALLISAIFFLIIVVIWPFLPIKKLFKKSDVAGEQTTASDDAASPIIKKQKSWQQWILPIIIALILTIWTIWGALFFLAVVWVMRMNPSPDASFALGNKEKSTARRVYTWLFLSPIITVPIFISMVINLSYNSSTTNERVLAALLPLIIHTPLLLGLTSKSTFVYRHTQQGILFIALRAGMAALAVSMGSYTYDGLGLFLLGNGTLWLVGSIVGWSQISSGKCWLMQRKGETLIISPDGVENLPAYKHIEQSKAFIQRYKVDEAKKHALAAFRSGDREIKSQATKLLDTLDEVEMF